MRVVFFSYGTRGDTQPQVAMAEGLKQRGFDVRVAAPENHQRFVEKAGLEFAPLFGNSQDILESEEGQRWLRTGNGGRRTVRGISGHDLRRQPA